MEDKVKVKTTYNGTSRRFEVSATTEWNHLHSQLSYMFNLGPNFCVEYHDDEDEMVTLSSQDELDEALKMLSRTSKLLHLYIRDPSSPQSSDTSLLDLEVENTSKKKKPKKNCYAELATLMAPELSALNARLEASDPDTPKEGLPLVVGNESVGEGIAEPMEQEKPKDSYINLAEVIAQSQGQGHVLACPGGFESNQKTPTEIKQEQKSGEVLSSPPENGACRGWFDDFENQRETRTTPKKNKSTKKKSSKKRGCYSELAEAMGPELARLNVNVDVKGAEEDLDSSIEACSIPGENDDSAISEDALTVLSGEPKTTNISEFKCTRQSPVDQNGLQQRKKKKRTKRHERQKGCYAELAKEMSPLFGAMNQRLKERQLHIEKPLNEQDKQNLQEASVADDFCSEPYILVSPECAMEVTDGFNSPKQPDKQPPSFQSKVQKLESEKLNRIEEPHLDKEDNELLDKPRINVEHPFEKENAEDVKVVVKQIINQSMDMIVDQTVQRIQNLHLNPPSTPSTTPQENDSPADDSKVLHKGITCDNCKIIIQGIRYKCCNCQDYDLCESCEEISGVHLVEHVFMKLRYPAPGIGRRHGEMVPIFKSSVYKKAHNKKQKDKEQQKRAAREAEKVGRKAAKVLSKEHTHAFKRQEKERKREDKTLRKEVKEMRNEEQHNCDSKKTKICHVHEKLGAAFITDASYPDGSLVPPGQKFLKSWVIENAGSIAWNQWIKLECIEGSIMVTPGSGHIDTPHLKPSEQGEVFVEFIAPELPGKYTSKWQLTYGLHTFGPHLWCEIEVSSRQGEQRSAISNESSLVIINDALPGKSDQQIVQELNLQAATNNIVEDGSSSEYLSSEESPETDPAYTSSPNDKSPRMPGESHGSLGLVSQQRLDLEWDDVCVYDADDPEAENLMTFSGTNQMMRFNESEESNGEDSDSSLDDFVVLIPPCFDPEASLSSKPAQVRVSSDECQYMSRSFSSPLVQLNSFGMHSGVYGENGGPTSLTLSMQENSRPRPAPRMDTETPAETPSENLIPRGFLPERPVTMETPVSKQPSTTTEPLTVERVDLFVTSNEQERIHLRKPSGNVVSEVLSSAIDVATMAGKAVIATVDNLLNGSVNATAVYKPEEDCEVTLNGRAANTVVVPIVSKPPTYSTTTAMDRLMEMGFCDRRLNQALLLKHKDDIRATVEELLGHTENEWSAQRH